MRQDLKKSVSILLEREEKIISFGSDFNNSVSRENVAVIKISYLSKQMPKAICSDLEMSLQYMLDCSPKAKVDQLEK